MRADDQSKPGLRTRSETAFSVTECRADLDGRFQVAVPTGKGYLSFQAFDQSYQKKAHRPKNATTMMNSFTVSANPMWDGGKPVPEFHALAEFDLAKDVKTHDVKMTVTRGSIIRGTAVGPDGKPISDGYFAGQVAQYLMWRPLSGAEFTINNYDPGVPRRVILMSKDKTLAETILLEGEVNDPLTIKLRPAASIKGRVVNEDGDPMANTMFLYGGNAFAPQPKRSSPPLAIWNYVEDQIGQELTTGEDGRFELHGLVAGPEYSVQAVTHPDSQRGLPLHGQILDKTKLQEGEVRIVGDIVVKKPDIRKLQRQAEAARKKAEEEAKKNSKGNKKVDAVKAELNRALQAGGARPVRVGRPEDSKPQEKEPKPKANPKKAGQVKNKQVDINGVVLTPDGRPLAGATLYWPIVKSYKSGDMDLKKVGQSDQQGRFVATGLPIPRDSNQFPIIATAEGFGMSWKFVRENPESHDIKLSMSEEFPIHGQVLNTEGEPLSGVDISFRGLMTDSSGKVDRFLVAWKSEWQGAHMRIDRQLYVALDKLAKKLGGGKTDANGQFEIHGIGSEHVVWINDNVSDKT